MKRFSIIILASLIVGGFLPRGILAAPDAATELNGIIQSIPELWWVNEWNKIPELQAFIAGHPSETALCAKAKFYIACNYYASKQYEKSVETYRAILQTYPGVDDICAKAQFELGQVYLQRLEDPAQAIIEYQKLIDNYPTVLFVPTAKRMIALANIKLNYKEQAKAVLQDVIKNYPLASDEQVQARVDLGDLEMNREFR